LQLPAPSQNPEQQASQASLQLQVPPQLTPSEIQVCCGWLSQTPEKLQYPVQQTLHWESAAQLSTQATPLSLHIGPMQAPCVMQVPGPPGVSVDGQQMSPWSQESCSVPAVQLHPSPVQAGGGHWSTGWQDPAPSEIWTPLLQQTKPSSQAP
jgi:hypothetical protein